MRLLMTTDTVGGVWTYTTVLAAELLPRDFAIALVVIGPGPSDVQAQWLAKMTAAWGANFYSELADAPLEWMSNNERAYSDAEPLLLRVAREFRAEALHSNQYCFGALPLNLPKLVIAHSDVLSWAAACRNRPIEPSAWLENYTVLTGAGLRAADIVVAPTQWMLEALAVNFALPDDARVIANGCTLHAPRINAARKLQAVTAGRAWDEAKNLQLLAGIQTPFPILIAGETEYQRQSAPQLGQGVSFLGWLDGVALLRLFRESAIYLCTSRYEPFGLAPLEAALSGCAVLANDIPSLREVWGEGALYFSDASSLSALLSQMSMHPDQLAAAQLRSCRRAGHYTAARMADEYAALYAAMLSASETVAHVA